MFPNRHLRFPLFAAVAVASLFVSGAGSSGPHNVTRAADPAANEGSIEARVREAIQGLDADTLAARNAAERALIELGPAALRWFPPPEELPSASAREAIRRIRLALERRQAADSLKPSRVEFDRPLPANQALDLLRRQTGNRFDVDASDASLSRDVRLDSDHATFWKALDAVADQTGLRLGSDADGLRLIAPKVEPPRDDETHVGTGREIVDYPGAFRVSATSAVVRPLVGDSGARLLRVSLRLAAEPRLRPLFLHFAASQIELAAGDGTRYRPYTPGAKYELTLTEGAFLDLAVDATVPAGAPDPKAVDLVGSLGVTVAAGTEPFEFVDLAAKSVSRRRGGVTVRVDEVEFSPPADGRRRADVRMSVAYDVGGPAFESHRTWIYFNQTWLTTKGGAKIAKDAGLNATAQPDGGLSVEYGFSGLTGEPRDYRFVYVAPTLIVHEPLRFTLRGIPTRVAPK